MTDERFFGVLLLLALAVFAVGFVVGWSVGEEQE